MPIYLINAEAQLYSEIRPEGGLYSEEIEDLEDTSYYSWREMEYDMEFRFSLEADDEESARQEAERLLTTLRYTDDDRWEIVDPEIVEIEAHEEPMTLERALQILRDWTNAHANARENSLTITLTPELMQAFDFILAYLVAQVAAQAIPTRPISSHRQPAGIVRGS